MKISGCRIGTQLSRLAHDQDSTLVADAADWHWQSIHQALSPIIGAQGVASLYRRSVFLARAQHPWLVEPSPAELLSEPLGSLRGALSSQASPDAAGAQGALLQIFNDLLGNLIGSSLTDRLLSPVWDQPPTGRDAEDIIP